MNPSTVVTIIGVCITGTFAVLVAAGALYQSIGTKLDEKTYSPAGKMIDIGGYRLHIHCTGEEGPTVLLDCGMRSNSLDWSLVQSEIAKFARVCSYDRPGIGWSESSPLERTSQNIVTELHTALQNANILGPYIVVGHSFGGLNMHLFARLYPDEVVGVILVDSASKNYDKLLKPKFNLKMMRLSAQLGLSRLFSHFSAARKPLKSFPLSVQDQYLALCSTTKFINTAIEEFLFFDQSAQQLHQIGSHLGNVPLTIITAGVREFWEGAGFTKEQSDEHFAQFEALQKKLLHESRHSKQIFATESDHMILRNQPEIIVEVVHEQVSAFRSSLKRIP